MKENWISEKFLYKKGAGGIMFKSLKDALVYPIRGHNFWKFLIFTFAISIVSFLTASTSSSGIGIIISIFISAYFWMCLYSLTQGDQNLPGLRNNAGDGAWRRGAAVQFMILIFVLPIAFLIGFAKFHLYLSLFLFAILFYPYFAIAVVRYIYEEKALVMYNIVENVLIVVQNWRTSLKLLVATAIVVIVAVAVYFAAVFVIVLVLVLQPPRPSTPTELNGVVIAISLIRDSIIWYVCFVNTYLFYRYGVMLGYFEEFYSKIKIGKLL